MADRAMAPVHAGLVEAARARAVAIEVVHAVDLARGGAGAGGVVDRVAGAAVLRAFRAGERGGAVAEPAPGEAVVPARGPCLSRRVSPGCDNSVVLGLWELIHP